MSKAIEFISKSARAINILMEIDNIFDDSGLYVFDGWLDGEILERPIIKGKWVYLELLYENMPDEKALVIFDNLGIRYKFTTKKQTVYYKDLASNDVENSVGYGYISYEPLERTSKPDYVNVYHLLLMIPKELLNHMFAEKHEEILDPEEEEEYIEAKENTSEEEEVEKNQEQ